MPIKSTFLALILAQACHSVEEYVFRLYDVFPPARFVSGLFSKGVYQSEKNPDSYPHVWSLRDRSWADSSPSCLDHRL